jgi:hypothetical protein
MSSITITPESAETGTAITVRVSPPLKETSEVTVRRIDQGGAVPFHAALIQVGNEEAIAQFALYEAGTYRVEAGHLQSTLSIRQHQDLSFFMEFFVWGALVIGVLGGILLWNRKRRNQERVAGSF